MAENKYIQYSYLPEMYEIYTPFVHIVSAIESCDKALLEIDKKLDSVYEMSGNGYASQIENFSTLLTNLQTMWQYLEFMPYDLDSLIDEPLNKKFANEATEGISRIKLDNFKTKETTGIKETVISTMSGQTYSAEIDKSEVGFADFLGSSLGDTKLIATNEYGDSSIKQTDCVKNFADLFKSDYDSFVNNSGYEGDLDSYLNSLMHGGAFEHKMDKPFLGFVSAVLDVTIIKPIVEACLGYDIITGEDLSDAERGMKVFGAVIEVIAIALAIPTDGASIPIWQTIVKVLVSDAAANGAGYLAAEAGLPVWAQIAIAAGVGIGTYKLGNKFFALIGDEVVEVSEETMKKIIQTGGSEYTYDDIMKALDNGNANKFLKMLDTAYDGIRADPDDIVKIANSSGMSIEEITQIKQHVFFEEHLLNEGMGRFAADEHMLDAWMRLENGMPEPSDIMLLNHELTESTYMATHPGCTYIEAHEYASQFYDWAALIREKGR